MADQPRLLDLFCKAGGASAGYARAGFDVTGVDIDPQPRYPYRFVQADAMTFPLDGYDVVAASPPCYDHSMLATRYDPDGTGWMLAATRTRLQAAGLPYVIECVAQADMPGSLVLCGTELGLTTRTALQGQVWLKRHRRFESNRWLWGAGGCNCRGKTGVPVYGHQSRQKRMRWRGPGVAAAAREVMGIDWMTWAELSQAIPPAMTEFIGRQLIEQLAA